MSVLDDFAPRVDDPAGAAPAALPPGGEQPPTRSESAGASALALALVVPERLDAVEAHVQRLEDAILTLASAIGHQRSQLTADVDDIVAHQGVAIRRLLEDLLERVPEPPLVEPPEVPRTRRQRRVARRQLRRQQRADHRAHRAAAKSARRAGRRRRGLLIPSLFLAAGLAGGVAIGLSPYTAEGETCDGPFSSIIDSLQGSFDVVPSAACERAAADRMLLGTVPALGGVMAAVAVVVMGSGSTSAAAPDRDRSTLSA